MSKLCVSCSALIEDNSMFCPNCGTKQVESNYMTSSSYSPQTSQNNSYGTNFGISQPIPDTSGTNYGTGTNYRTNDELAWSNNYSVTSSQENYDEYQNQPYSAGRTPEVQTQSYAANQTSEERNGSLNSPYANFATSGYSVEKQNPSSADNNNAEQEQPTNMFGKTPGYISNNVQGIAPVDNGHGITYTNEADGVGINSPSDVTSVGGWFGWIILSSLIPFIGLVITITSSKDVTVKNWGKAMLVLQIAAVVLSIIFTAVFKETVSSIIGNLS